MKLNVSWRTGLGDFIFAQILLLFKFFRMKISIVLSFILLFCWGKNHSSKCFETISWQTVSFMKFFSSRSTKGSYSLFRYQISTFLEIPSSDPQEAYLWNDFVCQTLHNESFVGFMSGENPLWDS